jgi:MFS family permease
MGELTKVVPGTYKAIASQLIGLTTDAYDLTVILTMTAILSKVLFPPQISPLIAAFAVVLSYSLTVIFRPLGAIIFGHVGDKIGRKYAMMVTIGGIGISGAAVGFLPTAAEVGILSYVFYLVLRMILGTFYGGEYASGWTYIIEWTPPKWRGLASGFAIGGYSIGFCIAGLVVGAVTSFLGETAMVAYGWRYIFIGGLAPVIVALIIRFSLRESPIFEMLKSKGKVATKAPFVLLFKKPVVFALAQAMVIMTGLLLLFSPTYYLATIVGSKPGMVSTALAAFVMSINGAAQFVGGVVYGQLSQIGGRRRVGMVWAGISFVLAIPLLYMILQAAIVVNVLLLFAISATMGFLWEGPYGGLAAYFSERFPSHLRASGVGFGFTTGYFLGGWYSFYIPAMHFFLFQSIDTPTNIWFSSAVLSMIGAIIAAIGYYIGPETAGKKIAEED